MIGIIVTLLVGALAGWLASLIMKTDAQQGAIANILIGIGGAFLGQLIFGNLLGFGSAFDAGATFNPLSILWAVLGAVILIAILKALNVLK